MRRNIHPAEELAEIRAQIRRLKAREAELRRYFLNASTPAEFAGPSHRVSVSTQQRRVFVKERLPPAILADERFYDVRTSQVIRVVGSEHVDLSPTPPTERKQTKADDSFDVIEAW